MAPDGWHHWCLTMQMCSCDFFFGLFYNRHKCSHVTHHYHLLLCLFSFLTEVARTRLRQEGNKYRTFFQTLITIFKEERYRGLYGGLGTHLVRQIPNTAIIMATYEFVVYLFNRCWAENRQSYVTRDSCAIEALHLSSCFCRFCSVFLSERNEQGWTIVKEWNKEDGHCRIAAASWISSWISSHPVAYCIKQRKLRAEKWRAIQPNDLISS